MTREEVMREVRGAKAFLATLTEAQREDLDRRVEAHADALRRLDRMVEIRENGEQ
jgi:hypothetical protein